MPQNSGQEALHEINFFALIHAQSASTPYQETCTCLHLVVAAPDGKLKHELLDGGEKGIDSGQPSSDDHVTRDLGRHEGVAVAVAAHP